MTHVLILLLASLTGIVAGLRAFTAARAWKRCGQDSA